MRDKIIEKLAELFKQEKKLGDQILNCLEEIESKKLYAEMGYPSLFEMLVKHFGLNENSAYMRISAMRLIKSVPAAKLALQNNQVSVSTLAQVQSYIKLEEKSHGEKLSVQKKSDLIEKIKDKSHSQVKRDLALLNPVFGARREKERLLNAEQTQLTIVIDQNLKEKLQKIKALTSHKNANPNYQELLTMMADDMLKKLEKQKTYSKPCVIQNDQASSKRTRYIPNHIKKLVWDRDQGKCKICESEYFVQIDHIKSYSQGGAHTPDNLQLLCFTHNQHKWRKAMLHI